MASKNIETDGITLPGPEIYMPGTKNVTRKRRKKSTARMMTYLLAAGLSFLPLGMESCSLDSSSNTVSIEAEMETQGGL